MRTLKVKVVPSCKVQMVTGRTWFSPPWNTRLTPLYGKFRENAAAGMQETSYIVQIQKANSTETRPRRGTRIYGMRDLLDFPMGTMPRHSVEQPRWSSLTSGLAVHMRRISHQGHDLFSRYGEPPSKAAWYHCIYGLLSLLETG